MTPGAGHDFTLLGAALTALASGALWWGERRLLVVSDLHLGKSERIARRGGALLPPFDTRETLARLDRAIEALDPATVLCLGDSFDDLQAADLPEPEALWLHRMGAGRRWLWIEGNHDPGPVALPGEHLAELTLGPLSFRHIATPGARGEVSGHYHPKARLAGRAHPCFLIDAARVILPAFGAYTGGLWVTDPAFDGLFGPQARAVLTGSAARAIPLRR